MEDKPEKIAIVTGASSGIGQALYMGLSAHFKVIGISRRGPDVHFDLAQIGRYRREFLYSLEDHGVNEVDLLINCAGYVELEENLFNVKRIMEVNFWAPVWLSELVTFREGGMILNIASVSGLIAEPNFPIYAASKAALLSITKSWAKRLAPKVRVNAISPGFYKSDLFPGPTPRELLDQVPMGYEDDPKNLVDLVLAIYNTPYMTGANVVVDGGFSL